MPGGCGNPGAGARPQEPQRGHSAPAAGATTRSPHQSVPTQGPLPKGPERHSKRSVSWLTCKHRYLRSIIPSCWGVCRRARRWGLGPRRRRSRSRSAGWRCRGRSPARTARRLPPSRARSPPSSPTSAGKSTSPTVSTSRYKHHAGGFWAGGSSAAIVNCTHVRGQQGIHEPLPGPGRSAAAARRARGAQAPSSERGRKRLLDAFWVAGMGRRRRWRG